MSILFKRSKVIKWKNHEERKSFSMGLSLCKYQAGRSNKSSFSSAPWCVEWFSTPIKQTEGLGAERHSGGLELGLCRQGCVWRRGSEACSCPESMGGQSSGEEQCNQQLRPWLISMTECDASKGGGVTIRLQIFSVDLQFAVLYSHVRGAIMPNTA